MSESENNQFVQQAESTDLNNNIAENDNAAHDQLLSTTEAAASTSEEVLNKTIEKPKITELNQPHIYLFNLKNIRSVENLNENIGNLILNNDGFGTVNGKIIIKKITRASTPTNELCRHCDHKHRQLCCVHKNDKVDEFVQYSNFIRDLDNNNKNYLTIFNDGEEEWLTGNISPNHYPKYMNGDPQFLENITKTKEVVKNEDQEPFNIKKWIANYTKFLNVRLLQREKALQQEKEILEQQRLIQQKDQEYILEQRRLQQRQRELLHQKQQELLEQIYLQPIQNTDFVAMINGQERLPTSMQHQVHLQHLYQNQMKDRHAEERKIRQQQMQQHQEEYDCYYRRMHLFFDSLANQAPPCYSEQQQPQLPQKLQVEKEKPEDKTENTIREKLMTLAIMQKNNQQQAERMQNSELKFNDQLRQENLNQNQIIEQEKPVVQQLIDQKVEQNVNLNDNNMLTVIPEEILSPQLDNNINPPQLNLENEIQSQLKQLIASTQEFNIQDGNSQQTTPQIPLEPERAYQNQQCQSYNQPCYQHRQTNQNQRHGHCKYVAPHYHQQNKYYHNHPNYNQQNIREELARIHDLMTLSHKIEENMIKQQHEKMKGEELLMKRKQEIRSNYQQSDQQREDNKD